MLVGAMVPIPKGRWTNLWKSDHFRAITLSSLFGKILYNKIVMIRKKNTGILVIYSLDLRKVHLQVFAQLWCRKQCHTMYIMCDISFKKIRN